jgi:aconitate hydratase
MAGNDMKNSFGVKAPFDTGEGKAAIYRLDKLVKDGVADINRLPFSIKVLLEALLRHENGVEVTSNDVLNVARYNPKSPAEVEIPFLPARVLMQDFTGVPAIVDLAAMRGAMARAGGDPQRINPLIPVDLVIDHSVQVDYFASSDALAKNAELEFERNRERYEFLRWGQQAFRNFRVIPPASGICHQVNLEYLGKVVQQREGEVFPDTLVGTDSHTTMINGLGIVGWGVGGIEAEAAMLGQPLYMLLPEVIGFKLFGRMPAGTTATDLVLTVTEILRKKKVVGKFVEFFGSGLDNMPVTDRATLANMAPEYGATMGFFPVDDRTLDYLRQTGRPAELVTLVERYSKEQGLFRSVGMPEPVFKDVVELDLGAVQPSLAGPKRPQDRVTLANLKSAFRASLTAPLEKQGFNLAPEAVNAKASVQLPGDRKSEMKHGDVAIAAITSCTNTSNPAVLIAAGLLAKKAVDAGLEVNPKVKTSLAPGSKVVTDYLTRTGLLPYLERLGFHVVGYGCTTCIGNSGPLPDHISFAIKKSGLIAASVLSGNRNFTGRVHPLTKASYLASPPLVVAFALAGTVDVDLTTEPIGRNGGKAIYLKDIWPSESEVAQLIGAAQDPETFKRAYQDIERANEMWNKIRVSAGAVYQWDENSTYLREPPFFVGLKGEPEPIKPITGVRVLVKAGDSVTTDHISPAGNIAADSPAGQYLVSRGVKPRDFNQYGARRGNDAVMTRGTFANVMFNNQLAQGKTGGWTTFIPSGEVTTIYDASLRYQNAGTGTLVIGGVDYGMGSSRDWAAKGTMLLGVRAVIAQSFERIHRSNLIGMGVLPLQFKEGENAQTLGLTGLETFTVKVDDNVKPRQELEVEAVDDNLLGNHRSFKVLCRLDTPVEVTYYRNGGILHTVLRKFFKE